MENSYKFKVNLGGMIDILSHHLYSSPNVFVRELLQNGIDAISARAACDRYFSVGSGKIEIEIVKGKRILFRDNGTGLDENEIHHFLSVIGQSSKYDLETSRKEGDYIGRFGIGLLSCFMVTDGIIVRTCSYKTNGRTLEWRGYADGTYTICESDVPMTAGTEVILENNKQQKDARTDDYYDSDEIANLVYYYGLFLQYPVYVINGTEKTRLNLQLKLDAKKNKELCLKTGKMFLGEDFLDCFNLESESGLFHGIAYVLPYPVAANARNLHRIYLDHMLLTESGDKLLPEWAFFLSCLIHTNGLTPTSSREDLYEDELLEQARKELSACIGEYFEWLEFHNEALLRQVVQIHHLAVKSVAAHNDQFADLLIPYIPFDTSLGEMTGRDIVGFDGRALYTTDINQFRQLAPIFTQRSELLINGGYVYGKAILERMSQSCEMTALHLLTEEDICRLMEEPELEDEEATQRFLGRARKLLRKYDCKAEIRQFSPQEIPTLYTINEQARQFRQIRRSKEHANPVFFDMLSSFEEKADNDCTASLYLNAGNVIVRKLIAEEMTEKTDACLEILYVQALLSGHFPLLHHEMTVLNENLYKLMR